MIALSLNSPLETIAIHYLLVIHLLQNVMIADWAPPLLVLGLTPAMREAVAARGGRPLAFSTRPLVALPFWLVVWYGVHLPQFYDYALRHPWLLNIEHGLLILAWLLFWWPVFSAERQRGRRWRTAPRPATSSPSPRCSCRTRRRSRRAPPTASGRPSLTQTARATRSASR